MATTTNYGWATPDDTALVKDGASAIRTLGSSIDTTTKNLNPETTLGDISYRSATANTNTRLPIGTNGQILSIASGVPAWVNNDIGDITAVTAGTGISGGGTSGDVTITNSMATAIDAKGDLIVGTGADAFSRLAVGTNNHVLTADSTTATGLKWAAASGGTTFSGVSTYKIGSAQSIANDTGVAITMDAEEFDTDGYHSTSVNTSRITIPTGKGGYYLFVGSLRFAANGTGSRFIAFYKNGSPVARPTRTNAVTESGATTWVNAVALLNVVAGDYFEVFGFQKSGGSLNVDNEQAETRFGCYFLGA
jgi:hypothetical protein